MVLKHNRKIRRTQRVEVRRVSTASAALDERTPSYGELYSSSSSPRPGGGDESSVGANDLAMQAKAAVQGQRYPQAACALSAGASRNG